MKKKSIKETATVGISEHLEIRQKYKVTRRLIGYVINREFNCKAGEEILLNDYEYNILKEYVE